MGVAYDVEVCDIAEVAERVAAIEARDVLCAAQSTAYNTSKKRSSKNEQKTGPGGKTAKWSRDSRASEQNGARERGQKRACLQVQAANGARADKRELGEAGDAESALHTSTHAPTQNKLRAWPGRATSRESKDEFQESDWLTIRVICEAVTTVSHPETSVSAELF